MDCYLGEGTRLPHASVAHLDGDYLGLETAGAPFFMRPTGAPPTANLCGKGCLPAYQLTSLRTTHVRLRTCYAVKACTHVVPSQGNVEVRAI